jgi:predicted nucleic acid-binding Zn finger protein
MNKLPEEPENPRIWPGQARYFEYPDGSSVRLWGKSNWVAETTQKDYVLQEGFKTHEEAASFLEPKGFGPCSFIGYEHALDKRIKWELMKQAEEEFAKQNEKVKGVRKVIAEAVRESVPAEYWDHNKEIVDKIFDYLKVYLC